MTPPEQPKRTRQPSQSEIQGVSVDKLVGRATDMVGATSRKQTFTGLGGAMKPPALPGELAPTLKAPAKPSLKETWNMPAPPLAVALARRTPVPPSGETFVPTDAATGQPGASLPPASLTHQEATIEALRRRAEAAEADRAEAERRLRVQLESKAPGPYQPPVPAGTIPKAAPVAPAEDEPTPRAWKAALFKVVVGLGAVLTAAATILGVRANTAIPKIETNAVRTDVVETKNDTLTDRVVKLETFIRSEAKRRNCVEAQLRDALARGTGHVLTTLPAEPTGWSEQNAPKNEPRLYWKSPTWFTVQGCDAAPAPP